MGYGMFEQMGFGMFQPMGYGMFEQMGSVTTLEGPNIQHSPSILWPGCSLQVHYWKLHCCKLDSYLYRTEMMMKKNKRGSLVTKQDIEAALQLINLKNCRPNFIASDQHLPSRKIHDPFMKIVLKCKEFLGALNINQNKKNISKGGDENNRKRKRDGTAWCSSSITFDLDDNSDEDANQAVGSVKKLKKLKKFRSIVDIYNVTKPLYS
ncbi:hypothetical protein POM88_043797 [Heracleum sosnowskyi]|uniref:Uncharacterized protein n=1 Tax=Heracleum sosnowskyi TaxID=360622 RepID=A0AAD8H406_9APIA|nr:hypothetical protein POM88_043797 [Heracleum sosnowskyi]